MVRLWAVHRRKKMFVVDTQRVIAHLFSEDVARRFLLALRRDTLIGETRPIFKRSRDKFCL
jgi:hypothetical protein